MFRFIHMRTRLSAVTPLLITAALSCSTQALAADRALCDAYVLEALTLAKQVRKQQCGFDLSHPQWSTDQNIHRRWCLQADVGAVDQERHNRRVTAQICSLCKDYAKAAIRSIEAAAKSACRVSGGARWINDEWAHYSWCAGLGHYVLGDTVLINSETDRETAARAQELGICVAQGPLVVEPAKPEIAKPLSSSRSTSRSKPSGPGAGPLSGSSPQRQSAKRKRYLGKELKSRSTPCVEGHGHPCRPATVIHR
jgi:hypothetical protein